MKVKIKLNESAIQAAQRHFEESKKFKAKAEGIKKGILDLERKLKELEQKAAEPVETHAPKVRVREARKREWFESFHWFKTSGGKLVVAGRDAKQNEVLYAKYLEPNDLFFHADIAGGAVTLLKEGKTASEQEKKETAQWAACFSKAWKLGYTSLDVYCVGKEHVSKSAPSGEYLAHGSFMITGKREWFRGTPLAVVVVNQEGRGIVLPANHAQKPERAVLAIPGKTERRVAAEVIKERVSLESGEEVIQALPGAVAFQGK